MSGIALPKHPAASAVMVRTALALAALLALTGCYARRSIPPDQPRLAKAPAVEQAPAAPAEPAPVQAAKPAPAKAKAAPAKAEPAPASQEKEAAGAPAEQAAPAVAERQSYVQVGAFSTTMNALGAVAWLKEKGYENSRMVRVEQGQGALFRVQAGPFQDLAAAHKALEELKPDWPQAFIPVD